MTEKEYNQTVDLFADRAYRFVLKSIRDEDKARDVIQDTFEKLWINHDNVNFLKAKSYIFTTAYHTMIDSIRKEKYSARMEEVNEFGYSHNEQYSDLKEVLNDAVDKLPEIQKTVILLRDYEGYSYSEIGEITNLNESQVKVYIYRARMSLQKTLGKIEQVI